LRALDPLRRGETVADDFDNTDDLENMSDDELLQHVRAELESQNGFDADDLIVEIRNGGVTISGRVGTEEELRIVEHVLTDVIGIAEVDNQLVVDEIRRAVSPEAIDEHLAEEDEHAGLLLGGVSGQHTSESEHLVDDEDEDAMGTHDITESIEGAVPWIPPESPTPEGVSGQDSGNLGVDGQR